MKTQITVKNQNTEKLVKEYLYRLQRDKTEITFKAYKYNLETFIDWFKQAQPKEPKEQMREYRAYLQIKYTNPKTVNLHLSTVRQFYKYLLDEGVIDYDPTVTLKNIKTNNDRTKSAIDRYDLSKLIVYLNQSKALHSKRDRALILLAVSNGLRVNELANTNIEDIQDKDGDKVLFLLRKGYTDKSCYTILAPKTYHLLMDLIGDRTEGAIFQGRGGKALKRDSISRIIREIFKKAGIKTPQISPHSLRHTFAMEALRSGCDIPSIAQAMNHKNISTTSTYLQSFNRHDKSPEKKIVINF